MPVLVSGAHGPLARRLALRLLAEGGEVRAYTDQPVPSLRAAGALVASGTPDDEGRLEAALTDVHTVVHVGQGLLSPVPGREADDTATLAAAATNAGVARIIALSVPGAGVDALDPLRRAKGAMEQILACAPIPTIVVRASMVDTPALRDALGTAGLAGQLLEVPVAPLRVEDLIELLVAFDAARAATTSGHLVVRADGPRRCRLGDHLADVGVLRDAADPSAVHRVGRRLVGAASAATLSAALAGPWWTDDAVVVDGWRFAGIEPTRPTMAGDAGTA